MQKDYINAEWALLHGTDYRYSVSIEGYVRDDRTTELVDDCYFDEDLNLHVNLQYKGKTYTFTNVLLTALAFKGSQLPIEFWHLVTVLFIDGNSRNSHPGNMIITYPEGGIECPEFPGMFYIPGFTQYVVNNDGTKVIFLPFKRELAIQKYGVYESTKDMAGYTFFTPNRDVNGKKTTLGMHRAVALAFHPFSTKVDHQDVNHKDCNKSNNYFTNLEWRTRRDNNLHATESGKRPDNHHVIVKSIFTGEERRYFSLWECARALGVHGQLILHRAKKEGRQVFSPGLLFKKVSCETPWIPQDMLNHERDKYRKMILRVTVIYDAQTGEFVQKFLTYATAKNFLEKEGKNRTFKVVITHETGEQVCKSLFAERQKSYLT